MKKTTNKGFSLVELIVVIAIMAILVGVAVPVYSSYVEKSQISTDQNTVQEIADALKLANNSGTYTFTVKEQYSQGLSKPVGFVVVSKDDLGEGYVETVMFDGDEDVLDLALKAKFGDNYATDLRLKYDGWNGSVGNFFSTASTMVGEVETMAGDAYTANKLLTEVGIPLFTNSYENEQDLFYQLSIAVKDKFNTAEDFATVWLGVTTVEYSFGFSEREFYSSIREAYNNYFASYVSTAGSSYTVDGKTHDQCATHIALIKDYGENAVDLGTAYIDQTMDGWGATLAKKALEEAFKNSTLYLPKTAYTTIFAEGGDIACAHCAALYEEYRNSEQAKSDAINLYNTFVTASTYDPTTNGDDIFDWMSSEAEQLAGKYDSVNDKIVGKSAIVLAVYSTEEGLLAIEVTPTDAVK